MSEKKTNISPKVRLLFIADLIEAGYATSPRGIWRRVAANELPKPFKMANKAAWREAAIIQHLETLQPLG